MNERKVDTMKTRDWLMVCVGLGVSAALIAMTGCGGPEMSSDDSLAIIKAQAGVEHQESALGQFLYAPSPDAYWNGNLQRRTAFDSLWTPLPQSLAVKFPRPTIFGSTGTAEMLKMTRLTGTFGSTAAGSQWRMQLDTGPEDIDLRNQNPMADAWGLYCDVTMTLGGPYNFSSPPWPSQIYSATGPQNWWYNNTPITCHAYSSSSMPGVYGGFDVQIPAGYLNVGEGTPNMIGSDCPNLGYVPVIVAVLSTPSFVEGGATFTLTNPPPVNCAFSGGSQLH